MPESAFETMDAYELFDIERSLVLKINELREIFRARARTAHPDGGGDVVGFSRLQEALVLLCEPSKRLKHWLELEGIEGNIRGSLSSNLVDLFVEISEKLTAVDDLIRERKVAGSHLARAMLESRVQASREDLEALQDRISALVDERVARFEEIERRECDGWKVARDLVFLQKWLAQVKERFAELW